MSTLRQRRIWQTTGSQQAVVASLVRKLKQEMGGLLVPGIDRKLWEEQSQKAIALPLLTTNPSLSNSLKSGIS
ncbi:MAG: hypothetical protein QNJ41_08645 [Xenococcaceae cyanobacterium MO_188.B32]|nr:hypothetical protein [Xenococcaceae cyanobacterium MO_188.B32]